MARVAQIKELCRLYPHLDFYLASLIVDRYGDQEKNSSVEDYNQEDSHNNNTPNGNSLIARQIDLPINECPRSEEIDLPEPCV